MNHIKVRLGAKVTSHRCANTLIRERRIGLVDLDRLTTPSGRGGVGHQLRMTAFLQTDEPEDALFDRLSDGQETVVLEEGGFLGSEGFGDVLAFFFGEDDAVELFVDHVVLGLLACLFFSAPRCEVWMFVWHG